MPLLLESGGTDLCFFEWTVVKMLQLVVVFVCLIMRQEEASVVDVIIRGPGARPEARI